MPTPSAFHRIGNHSQQPPYPSNSQTITSFVWYLLPSKTSVKSSNHLLSLICFLSEDWRIESITYRHLAAGTLYKIITFLRKVKEISNWEIDQIILLPIIHNENKTSVVETNEQVAFNRPVCRWFSHYRYISITHDTLQPTTTFREWEINCLM